MNTVSMRGIDEYLDDHGMKGSGVSEECEERRGSFRNGYVLGQDVCFDMHHEELKNALTRCATRPPRLP